MNWQDLEPEPTFRTRASQRRAGVSLLMTSSSFRSSLGRVAPALVPSLAALLAAAPLAAQSDAIPRTASGLPDLNGIWQALGNAHWDIEPHLARPALQMQEGPVVPVPANEVVHLGAVGSVPAHWGVVVGGEIPYLPEALAQRNENREDYLNRDPEVKCYLPGVPRATYMPFPFQIFQSESHFFIAYEYAGAVRNIYLQDPGPPQVDSWMGQSVGRWEDDVFVTETTGFNGQMWFDRAGNHHSYQLRVVERYEMIGPDHIMYEATMEDPNTFSRPWTCSRSARGYATHSSSNTLSASGLKPEYRSRTTPIRAPARPRASRKRV